MKILRFLFLLCIVFVICFLISGGHTLLDTSTIGARVEKQLPAIANNVEPTTLTGSRPVSTLDRLSRLLFLPKAVNRAISDRNYVTIDYVALPMQQAIISVEDNRFYSHWGFDIEGILRASLVNLQYGRIEEGASTITQQLVKNMFLSQDQSFGRKAEELLLAVDMEAHYSKEQILELYLNTIYFGSDFYGINDACRGYFGKKPADLTLAEASLLAGLPNAPSLYSPYTDYAMAKKRQAIVLDSMVHSGLIAPSTAEKAKSEPLHFTRETR